ncbi:hypothetical protein [Metamycoplasma hyosynoviae]|uniref:hypothetical protein n=1 Tax=Metamycoplasma hyosynoviae TaxID=29559 RepID=UPI0013E01BEE|nr:hypothetical protein [Metamycoplasma hyosynoviae]
MLFSKFVPKVILKKITKYQDIFNKYEDYINKLENQYASFLEKTNRKMVNENDTQIYELIMSFEKSKQSFDSLFLQCNFKITKHIEKHSGFETKCVVNILRLQKNMNKILSDGKLIHSKINALINEKIIIPQTILEHFDTLQKVQKNIDYIFRQNKNLTIFFIEKIKLLNLAIKEVSKFFLNDIYLTKSVSFNVSKLQEYNKLIREKLLVASHGEMYRNIVENSLPNLIIKNNYLVEDNDKDKEYEKAKKKYNELLIYLKDELGLLNFVDNESWYSNLLFDIIEQIYQKKSLRKFKYHAKVFLKQSMPHVIIDIDEFKVNQEENNKEINSLYSKIPTNVVNEYIANNEAINEYIIKSIVGIKNIYDEAIKKEDYIKTLNDLKNKLIEYNELKKSQIEIFNNIQFYRNERNVYSLRFQSFSHHLFMLINACDKFKVILNEEENQEFALLLMLDNKLKQKFENENYENVFLIEDVDIYSKRVFELSSKINLKIECAKVTKIIVQKIAPYVSSDETMKKLYEQLSKLNNLNKYEEAIETIYDFLQNHLN